MDINEVKGTVEGVKSKVTEILDKTDIDEKIIANSGAIKDKVTDILDKTDIDDKIIEKAKDVVGKFTGTAKDDASEGK